MNCHSVPVLLAATGREKDERGRDETAVALGLGDLGCASEGASQNFKGISAK